MGRQQKLEHSSFQIRLPLIISASLALGILIGSYFFGDSALPSSTNNISQNGKKLQRMLEYINDYYVDEVDIDQLTEKAIAGILEDLDPHTSYIPARNADVVNSHLREGFEGIGIEFAFIRDTIRVLTVLPNGPSDKAGILAGDKLLYVDGKEVSGQKMKSDDLVDMLRGKGGSKVELGVQRFGHEIAQFFTVERGDISTPTIDIAYMLDDAKGYIKVDRFGNTTHEEFVEQVSELKKKGLKDLIIDLRDNGGGFLSQAVKIADELIAGKKLIVSTDGRLDAFDDEEFSGNEGVFEEGKVAVLLNENSASASEVLSGALQDHDRAIIVGRRSFGKGLVQRQVDLGDKSYLRLTISKYFTPVGRSIQKPYEDYSNELDKRYVNGEYFSADSVHFSDSLAYLTDAGRTVYGGGGIMPDLFVAYDTSYITATWRQLIERDLIRDFAIEYASQHRKELLAEGVSNFIHSFSINENLIDHFLLHAQNYQVEVGKNSPFSIQLKNQLKAYIGRTLWKENAFFPVLNQEDRFIKVAHSAFEQSQELLVNHTK